MLDPVRQLAGALIGSASTPHPTPPAALPPGGPPSRSTLAGEALSGLQIPRLILAAPRLARVPRGDGSPVVDIPGWRAPESSMAPLRAYLRRLGYEARTWGMGTNMGDPRGDAERMAEMVAALSRRAGRPVSLVGWSLGGVIAREVAREVPEHVRRVITYGTPVLGGPAHTVAASNYEAGFGDEVDRIVAGLDADAPISVPITAIFTRRDGIVAWQACIDRASPEVEHIEVSSTHIGLGVDPDVWEIVGRTLAKPVIRG
jgi:pimeloyl-ACP methyl ester carboxylesterase